MSPGLLCEQLLIYHTEVVRGYMLLLHSQLCGRRVEEEKWVHLCCFLVTHGVGDSVLAGVRN